MGTVAHSGAADDFRAPSSGAIPSLPARRRSWLPLHYPQRLPSLRSLIKMLDYLLTRTPLAGSAAATNSSSDAATDVALVQASLRGDRAALAVLYRRYADSMRTLARIMLGNGFDAEDVLHDVFVESWQKLGSFDPARGSVRIWLLVRLRSRVIDRLGSHHRRRLVPLADEEIEPSHCAPADRPAAKYLATVVRRGCSALPAQQRQLLDKLYVYDMTLTEIAAELRVPVGTIKSRLNRLLSTLRKEKGVVSTGRSHK